MHPGSLEVDGKFLEDVSGNEKTFVFDVDETCVHPCEVIGVEGIVGEGFGHHK